MSGNGSPLKERNEGMNKSRIRNLEKRLMPEPDPGLRSLMMVKSFREELYCLRDMPDRLFRSSDEAVEVWEAEHGRLPLGCKVIIVTSFAEGLKLRKFKGHVQGRRDQRTENRSSKRGRTK